MRGDSLKERILRVATIEEVVAAYVPLQRSGAGYVGLCPFHADKHPSLHVHPGKQFFKCFACGEGGDLFAFVQKIEGCSFTEAMGKLAKRYSIDSREWTVDNYAGKAMSIRKNFQKMKVRSNGMPETRLRFPTKKTRAAFIR